MYYKLTLTQPPTLNQTTYKSRTKGKNSYSIANAQKQKWTNRIAQEVIRLDLLPFDPHECIYVFGEFFPATVTSDSDNMLASLKYVYDGLKRAGLIADDSIKYIGKYSYFTFTKKKYIRGEAANKVIHLHLTNESEIFEKLVIASLCKL